MKSPRNKIKNILGVLLLFSVFFSCTHIASAEERACIDSKPKISQSLATFKTSNRISNIDTIFITSATSKKSATTHFFIDRYGKIYRLASETKVAPFSKDERMPDGRFKIQDFAIGITLMQDKWEAITNEQYTSLSSLSASLSNTWKIKSIVTDRGLVADFVTGPYGFDWSKFKSDYDSLCSTFVNQETTFACPKSTVVSTDLNLRSITKNPLNKSYIAPNLVPINPEYSEGRMFCIKEDTYIAYKQMRADASTIGLAINVNSAFRDSVKQDDLYKESKKMGLINRVAEIGKSEHQLGTAFDFYSGTTSTRFVKTPEYLWMTANGWKYGFVESYRRETPTGLIQNEPWHWRYIGVAEAKKLYDNKFPLIAYLESRQ